MKNNNIPFDLMEMHKKNRFELKSLEISKTDSENFTFPYVQVNVKQRKIGILIALF